MRRVLRAAGKVLVVYLWIVKGLLLILAVATLVVWPMSRGTSFTAWGNHFDVGRDQLDEFHSTVTCGGGRIAAEYGVVHALGKEALAITRLVAEQHGDGWKWHTDPSKSFGINYQSLQGWGPLRWEFKTVTNSEYAFQTQTIGISCWLLAPLLALWPVTSLALSLRRRTRRRRRLARGCCLSCGYDLRATPLPGGQTLARCSECGAESAAAKANLSAETQSSQRTNS